MKEISELNLQENVLWTDDHEWANVDGDVVRIGVSDYAQDQLGDIVFVELPDVGDTFKKGEEFETVESVKAGNATHLDALLSKVDYLEMLKG